MGITVFLEKFGFVLIGAIGLWVNNEIAVRRAEDHIAQVEERVKKIEERNEQREKETILSYSEINKKLSEIHTDTEVLRVQLEQIKESKKK